MSVTGGLSWREEGPVFGDRPEVDSGLILQYRPSTSNPSSRREGVSGSPKVRLDLFLPCSSPFSLPFFL